MLNPYVKNLTQYKNNEILTATPEKLMIMLYDAAIQFLFKARKAIEENKPSDICTNIIGCQKILREFMKTIDLENGVDVGRHLFVFYDKLVKMLYKVNRKRDTEMLEEVITELKTLRKAFLDAIDIASKEKSESLIDSEDSYSESDY